MGNVIVSGETKLWVCDKNLHVLNVSPVGTSLYFFQGDELGLPEHSLAQILT